MSHRGSAGVDLPADGRARPDIAALYLRYREAMHGVAASVLRGPGLLDYVEDVVMDVVTSVMEKPPEETIENWEAYLVRVTRNKAIDLVRSAHVRHHGGAIPIGADPPADDYTADAAAERVDDQVLGGHLWDLMAQLDPRDRYAVFEVKGKGRSRDDIARELGVSPPRVSQITTAALRKLRDAFGKEGLQR